MECAGRRLSFALEEPRSRLGVVRGKLSALDPTAVLTRGYAIVLHRSSGRAVRSVGEAAPGESLDVRVSDGVFGAIVEGEKG
jgi:exodeoxyribonuclease VII large subunit